MLCPFCQHPTNEVTNKRSSILNSIPGIRRRRECLKCHQRFSTFEYVCEIPRGNVPRTVFHPGYDPVEHGNGAGRGIVEAKKAKRDYRSEIKQAMIRARQKLAQELDELDANEFDDFDFD